MLTLKTLWSFIKMYCTKYSFLVNDTTLPAENPLFVTHDLLKSICVIIWLWSSCDQSQMIKQAKFIYSPLGKAFQKQKQSKTKEKISWGFKTCWKTKT